MAREAVSPEHERGAERPRLRVPRANSSDTRRAASPAHHRRQGRRHRRLHPAAGQRRRRVRARGAGDGVKRDGGGGVVAANDATRTAVRRRRTRTRRCEGGEVAKADAHGGRGGRGRSCSWVRSPAARKAREFVNGASLIFQFSSSRARRRREKVAALARARTLSEEAFDTFIQATHTGSSVHGLARRLSLRNRPPPHQPMRPTGLIGHLV